MIYICVNLSWTMYSYYFLLRSINEVQIFLENATEIPTNRNNQWLQRVIAMQQFKITAKFNMQEICTASTSQIHVHIED